jgi:acyl-CoA synthetase (AMP-forming)/AMP-acid ligase II
VLFVETEERDPAVFTDFLKDKLDLAQMPREVHVLEKFPRHSLVKIHRAALLAALNGGTRG